MFGIIGGVVVYGFALYGVYKVLEGKVAARQARSANDDTG